MSDLQSQINQLQSRIRMLEMTLKNARSGAQRITIAKTLAQACLQLEKLLLSQTKPVSISTKPQPQPQGLVRALCIGINYTGTSYELYGCINDATNIATQLRSFFPTVDDVRLLTDTSETKPTKANILAGIDWLVRGLVPGQNIVFHYSGHGGRVRDRNGDEASGLDSCIYALGMQTITDDEIRSALATRIPAGCKCLVLLDSCHSGSAVDLRYRWQAPTADRLTYSEVSAYSKTNGSVLFVSGCRDTEYAMDTVGKDDRPCGAMTMALLDTWRTYGPGIKLKYLLWDIRKYLKENGYSQIPQMETGKFEDMNTVWDLGRA